PPTETTVGSDAGTDGELFELPPVLKKSQSYQPWSPVETMIAVCVCLNAFTNVAFGAPPDSARPHEFETTFARPAAVFSAIARSASSGSVASTTTILHLWHMPRTDCTSSASSTPASASLAGSGVVAPVWFTIFSVVDVSAGKP